LYANLFKQWKVIKQPREGIKMESGIVAYILKSKVTIGFLVLWGLTFLFNSITDLEYYAENWTANTLRDIQSITWITYDVILILAGIFVILLAIKLLKAK
jgi:hypothetical protein